MASLGELAPSLATIVEQTVADEGGGHIDGQIDEQSFHPFWSSKKESRRGSNVQKCLRLDQIKKELEFYEYPRRDYPMFSWEIFTSQDTWVTPFEDSKTTYVRQSKFAEFSVYMWYQYGLEVTEHHYAELIRTGECGIMGKKREYFVLLKRIEWRK